MDHGSRARKTSERLSQTANPLLRRRSPLRRGTRRRRRGVYVPRGPLRQQPRPPPSYVRTLRRLDARGEAAESGKAPGPRRFGDSLDSGRARGRPVSRRTRRHGGAQGYGGLQRSSQDDARSMHELPGGRGSAQGERVGSPAAGVQDTAHPCDGCLRQGGHGLAAPQVPAEQVRGPRRPETRGVRRRQPDERRRLQPGLPDRAGRADTRRPRSRLLRSRQPSPRPRPPRRPPPRTRPLPRRPSRLRSTWGPRAAPRACRSRSR
ncbi:MAG: hypothetical protein KatS3mg076_1649 [Candidatus Binatia bacterium]|nr:MAG: hypothetical protein KatS3mg076_1649 [Candidatus Binatia bacterium]